MPPDDLLTGREIRDNLFVTLWRAGLGLALGSIAGVWLGLMMARSPVFRAYAAPIVGGTYSLPKSALIPLFILWFGIGTATTVCAVFLACLLPMVVNTAQGVSSTPRVLVWGAEAFGTQPRAMLWRVYLPHALPDIFAGLRVALGFSFVLAISSEMIASTNGIGKLIFMYGENGAYDYMFAAIACVVVVAFLADRLLLMLTEKSLRWHESAAGTMMEEATSQRGLFLRSLASVFVIVVIWEAAARAGLAPALFLPPFTKVIAEWWSVCADGSLPVDLGISLSRAAVRALSRDRDRRAARHCDGAQPLAALAVRSGDRAGLSVAEDRVPADLHSLVRHLQPVENPAGGVRLRVSDPDRQLLRRRPASTGS